MLLVLFFIQKMQSDVPHKVHSTPSETGTEGGEDQLVALVEEMFVLIQAQGN